MAWQGFNIISGIGERITFPSKGEFLFIAGFRSNNNGIVFSEYGALFLCNVLWWVSKISGVILGDASVFCIVFTIQGKE